MLRQLLFQIIPQIVDDQGPSLSCDNICHQAFVTRGIFPCHHHCLSHLGMLSEHLLDLS